MRDHSEVRNINRRLRRNERNFEVRRYDPDDPACDDIHELPVVKETNLDLLPAKLHQVVGYLLDTSQESKAHVVALAAKHLARYVRDHHRPATAHGDPVEMAMTPDIVLDNPIGHWYVYVGRGPRDVVLYVGMTGTLFERLGQHQGRAVADDPHGNWMKYATHVEVYECSSQRQALWLERNLILVHEPPGNVAGLPRKRTQQTTMDRGRRRGA